MRLNDGTEIHRFVKDSCGEQAYVMWIANCFSPTVYLVRGENFSDAYDWFLCDPKVEAELKIEDFEMGDYDPETVNYNDNGTMIDDEAVNGHALTLLGKRYGE